MARLLALSRLKVHGSWWRPTLLMDKPICVLVIQFAQQFPTRSLKRRLGSFHIWRSHGWILIQHGDVAAISLDKVHQVFLVAKPLLWLLQGGFLAQLTKEFRLRLDLLLWGIICAFSNWFVCCAAVPPSSILRGHGSRLRHSLLNTFALGFCLHHSVLERRWGSSHFTDHSRGIGVRPLLSSVVDVVDVALGEAHEVWTRARTTRPIVRLPLRRLSQIQSATSILVGSCRLLLPQARFLLNSIGSAQL